VSSVWVCMCVGVCVCLCGCVCLCVCVCVCVCVCKILIKKNRSEIIGTVLVLARKLFCRRDISKTIICNLHAANKKCPFANDHVSKYFVWDMFSEKKYVMTSTEN